MVARSRLKRIKDILEKRFYMNAVSNAFDITPPMPRARRLPVRPFLVGHGDRDVYEDLDESNNLWTYSGRTKADFNNPKHWKKITRLELKHTINAT